MKKIKYLILILYLVLFIPKVYAFSYDMEVNAGQIEVSKGTVKNVEVTLRNVLGILDGFGACSLNIDVLDGVSLNGKVAALSNWAVTTSQNFYMFDTADSFVSNTEMFSIPVKISDAGSLKITNITCSDGETNEFISDKVINFHIKHDSSNSLVVPDNNNSNNNNNDDDESNLNGTVTDIVLSEGSINFASDVYEYNVEVSDFTQLNVTVEYTGSVSYTIDKLNENGNKFIVISIGEDGAKSYRINVNELTDDSTVFEPLEEKNDDNNSIKLIFMIIIGILVLLNIFRVARKFRKS